MSNEMPERIAAWVNGNRMFARHADNLKEPICAEDIKKYIRSDLIPDVTAMREALVKARKILKDELENDKMQYPDAHALDSTDPKTGIFERIKFIAEIDAVLGETK